jgi:processive 1,2-diacylglycerol beta-glucosyltransferase
MPDRVLILSASSGNGHVRAADALEQAFLLEGGAKEVRNVDALQHTSLILRSLYNRSYIHMCNRAPQVLGWLYQAADKPFKEERRRLMFDRMNTRRLIHMIRKYNPDVVISTHFLPAEIVSWMSCKGRLKALKAIVVTDLDAHSVWLCRHYDHYFTALEETKLHLESLGIDKSRISVTGIPIDPVFAKSKDKRQLRLKFGLQPDVPTIILSSGGYGVGRTEQIIESLRNMKNPVQLIAMCGRNERLKEKLDHLAGIYARESNFIMKAVSFTHDVDEYMAASDMVLGKPGGLTTAEALARGLVFVIVNPIPGQEERNSDHLLEEGAAIRCNNLPTLAYKIDSLLDEPGRLEKMRENALRLGKPNAAVEIVRQIADMKPSHDAFTSFPEHSCESPVLKVLRKTAKTLGSKTISSRQLRFRAVKSWRKAFRQH